MSRRDVVIIGMDDESAVSQPALGVWEINKTSVCSCHAGRCMVSLALGFSSSILLFISSVVLFPGWCSAPCWQKLLLRASKVLSLGMISRANFPTNSPSSEVDLKSFDTPSKLNGFDGGIADWHAPAMWLFPIRASLSCRDSPFSTDMDDVRL